MSTAAAAAAPVNIRRAEANASLPTDYSTTPHGTIYSSTPGGTRVIYDRDTLLALSNSELAKTPPTQMAFVAGVTKTVNDSLHPNSLQGQKKKEMKREEEAKKKTYNPFAVLNDDDMFEMEA
ncbi:eukaryotic translation initiation factor 4E binding protein [Syncephalastrum racemosum]|uniref:Eukaryotic translation initiation factor 4E binding protein n=1 Tax=Syncephalastrum racemosum TaxID=13706 RepID=A0A1X2HDN4_SYNRA|nr:eukaryotic translation initiation factor 4E binding protein [Syncephalastrum racemosum]